jgi:hypothetical protein
MSTSIINNITVINDEGDILDIPQITISSITINQPLSNPISVTYSPSTVLITRKTIDPVIITAPV